jgi:2-C-methyl-D-erythritol 4-phosphate cytidylyltransferase
VSAFSGSAGLTVVVVAAGESRRFGPNKLFQSLDGRPVLDWSLTACERSPLVAEIILVVSEACRPRTSRLVARRGYRKLRTIVPGGRRRQDSVWNGLQEAAGADWVAIHDAARPFLNDDLIERTLAAARQRGAAIAAVPVKDTVKLVGTHGAIEQTPARSGLWAAQTPQIFRYASLVAAFRANDGRDATDDAELVERLGQPVAVVMGSYDNLKITTPEDLHLARAIARRLTPHPLPRPPVVTRDAHS